MLEKCVWNAKGVLQVSSQTLCEVLLRIVLLVSFLNCKFVLTAPRCNENIILSNKIGVCSSYENITLTVLQKHYLVNVMKTLLCQSRQEFVHVMKTLLCQSRQEFVHVMKTLLCQSRQEFVHVMKTLPCHSRQEFVHVMKTLLCQSRQEFVHVMKTSLCQSRQELAELSCDTHTVLQLDGVL